MEAHGKHVSSARVFTNKTIYTDLGFSGFIATGLLSGMNTIEIEAIDASHPGVKTVASTAIDLTGRST